MPVASGWFQLGLLDAHTGAAFDVIYRDANGPIAPVMDEYASSCTISIPVG
jgi:hypothetical protein